MSETAVGGRLREADPAEWDELLSELGCADAYYLRRYVEASCFLEPGDPILLHVDGARGAVFFAAIRREIPGARALTDVTTPYGYGGPLAAGPAAPVEAFWPLYEDWCRERGVVATFVRFHPLFANAALAPATVPRERVADTATWPIGPGVDLVAGMHSTHRRGARKAERAGVEISIERAPHALDDFVAVYEAAMRRLDAAPFYFFPAAYWDALARLDARLVRADARLDGEILATQLHLANDGGPPWLHYHLGATSERGFAVGASKLLFLRVAEWGAEHGFRELHLGSGIGGREDSLWQFKQRFSPHPGREFWLGKLVHDPDAYRALTGSGEAGAGFFPAYRSPPR